jgi:23S rRNA pseudouridine2605 synthase
MTSAPSHTPAAPPAAPAAPAVSDTLADAARFEEVVSGQFDAAQAQDDTEPELPGKRVLQPQFDAPKLHKVLAQAGLGSRLEMEILIQQGRVLVNHEPAHVGQRIQYGDSIRVDGRPVRVRIAPPPPRVLAYHKPAGEVVTHDDPQNRPTVFRRLPRLQHGKWQSVGRLDLNTEGLLLFTDSGELANQLMHPRFGLQREYAVRVLGALSNDEKQRLLDGVRLDDGMAQFQSIEDGGGDGANCWYRVTIAEGRNREVRRMFEAVGHAVSRLIRIRYGAVMLPRGLRRGVWLELDARDIERLTSAAGMVRREEERPAARPASRVPTPPRRNKGNGPRPSAPRLVDGPSVPRGGFTASNPRRDTARWRDNDAYSDEGRHDPRDLRDTASRSRNFGAGQPAPQGYIGADFKPRTRSGNNGFVAGAPAGKPGRKGPRR